MSDGRGPGDVQHHLRELADRLEGANFETAFRGYEPRQVHDELKAVAAEIRRLAAGEADVLEDSLDGYRASNVASDVVAKAHAQAEDVLRQAIEEARAIRREAVELREQARERLLETIRDANALMARSRAEAGDTPA